MRHLSHIVLLLLTICAGVARGEESIGCLLMEGMAKLTADRLQPKAPEDLPRIFVLLGFFGDYNEHGEIKKYLLGDIGRKIESIYPYRRVGQFYNFPEVGLRDFSGPRDNMSMVKYAVAKSLLMSPGKQSIFVVLDGFSMDRAFEKTDRGVKMKYGYLNQEVDLILRNPEYFRATRWLRQGRELTPDEIRLEFFSYFPERFL